MMADLESVKLGRFLAERGAGAGAATVRLDTRRRVHRGRPREGRLGAEKVLGALSATKSPRSRDGRLGTYLAEMALAWPGQIQTGQFGARFGGRSGSGGRGVSDRAQRRPEMAPGRTRSV
jgi:hypothetical protein